MDQNQDMIPQNKENAYKGFTFRQRLVPVLLVAIALGLTLCIIGPCDIFFNNIEEFSFSVSDFVLWSTLFCLLTVAIVSGILLPLKGRYFDVAYAIFFALTFLLFLQGNYLNIGLNSLAGDGQGESANQAVINVINTIVWVLVMAGCVASVILIKGNGREMIRTVGTIAMVTVIGMQLIPLVVGAMTAQSKDGSDENDRVLTYENFNVIGKENNVLYFVIDRFDYSFYENYAKHEAPELFEGLDGFTYYADTVTLYPRTYPAAAYMVTGVEHDFLDARTDYLDDAYENSPFLRLLQKEGYDINIYVEEYYSYNRANSMADYCKNVSNGVSDFQVVNKVNLSWDMLRLSLYRYFPFAAKKVVGNISTPEFAQYIVYDTEYPKYTLDMKNAYEFLSQNGIQVSNSKKNFSFIHIDGCHTPNLYNENFEACDASEAYDVTVSLKQSFKIINMYIDKLKELGLYENATIIIGGDHGSLLMDNSSSAGFAGADTVLLNERNQPFLSALFVKPSGKSSTPLAESYAPIAQADLIPTILFSEKIETELDFGRTIYEVGEDEIRERKCVFHRRLGNDEEVVFKIVGSGRDLNNWTVESRGKYIGDLYE